MNDKQRRRYERLARVHNLSATLSASFPTGSQGGKAIASLASIIGELETLDASRSTNQRISQQGTRAKEELRNSLRAALAMISRTAKTIALDLPELKGKFRLPGGNTNTQDLLGTARSFVVEATPLKDKFIEYDMPADFLDRLNALINSFEEASNLHHRGTSARVSNRTGINETLERGEEELERLDTVMRNKFHEDHSTLAAWTSARHLERAPRSRKVDKGNSPPATS